MSLARVLVEGSFQMSFYTRFVCAQYGTSLIGAGANLCVR
jgi:hypothetical protein